MSEEEERELAALYAVVRLRDSSGRYHHWSQSQRDRVRELLRKQCPDIQFVPSAEEMARRFGHLARDFRR